MILLKILLWFMVTFVGAVFVTFFLLPYVIRWIALWRVSRILRGLAKKRQDNDAVKINQVADMADDIRKEQKL